MADNTPASPEGLQLRAAPRTSARLSKKAAFVAVTVGALVLGIIMVNVSKPPPTPKGGAAASKDLQPALNMASSLTKDVPDVVPPPPLPAKPEPPPEPPPRLVRVEQEKPATRDFAAEARLADSEVPKFVEMQSASMRPAVAGYSASASDETPTQDTRRDTSGSGDSGGEAIATGQGSARPGGGEDLNQQGQKAAFLKAAQRTGYLRGQLVAPLSPYELKTGTVIPGVLVGNATSDLPGELLAQVSQNVYDSVSGSHVLIPQGSKLFGHYDSAVTFGQSRMLVRWQRLIYPNGYTLELSGMQGHDQEGNAGFKDQVDNHLGRLFGWALLSSAITAGVQLSQPQQSSSLLVPSSGQVATAAVGQQVGQLGVQIAQRNLQVQPTLVIRKGYRINVMVNKDIVFPAEYQP